MGFFHRYKICFINIWQFLLHNIHVGGFYLFFFIGIRYVLSIHGSFSDSLELNIHIMNGDDSMKGLINIHTISITYTKNIASIYRESYKQIR